MSERDREEGRSLALRTAAAVAALSWDELDSYEPREDQVTLASGHRFRVKSNAYWDMDARQSDMHVSVKVHSSRGWRRYRPYTARAFRAGEDQPEQVPPSLQ
jgi:hypothetical protein